MQKKIIALFLIACSFELTGCATNASVDQMVYKNNRVEKPKHTEFVDNVAVKDVVGGSETNPLLASQINNEGFKSALEESLKQAGLFHKLNGERYLLKANLIKLDQPLLGLNLKVVCQVHYTIDDIKLNKTIYDKTITSEYIATFGDSAIAIKRLKMANEGAARKNIEQLINDIYRL